MSTSVKKPKKERRYVLDVRQVENGEMIVWARSREEAYDIAMERLRDDSMPVGYHPFNRSQEATVVGIKDKLDRVRYFK